MPNQPATDDALKYLKLVESAPAEKIGPHRLFLNPATDAEALRELAPDVIGAVQQLDERTYMAPSPWHAAAWMLDLAALVGQMAEVDKDIGLHSPFRAKHGAPVFRGQRDPKWKIVPAILREPFDARNLLSLEVFIESLTELFELVAEDTRMNGRYIHMAAAQHYGMPTPLLDFTADPRIAVFFACEGANPEQDEQVVVYGMPFNILADFGGAVVLPPPWIRRLYVQRGLFLDCSELSSEVDLRDLCFRVLFPPDKRYSDSMFPEGVQTLLPPDLWYERAIQWARDTVQLGDLSPGSEPHVEMLRRECGPPPFYWDALSPVAMKVSLDGFVDMCEWLALKSLKGTLTYDCHPILYMWKHNEPLFRSHRVAWKFMSTQFQAVSNHALRQNRMMAAMEAITLCVERKPVG